MLILDKSIEPVNTKESDTGYARALAELEQGVRAALETYSNVHRGTGHNSRVSTILFEQARDIILGYLKLDKDRYEVVFCTPWLAEILMAQLGSSNYHVVSSQDIGLPIGIRALVAERNVWPGGVPFQSGGGTIRMVSPNSVVWSEAPDRFEAGTPNIVNAIVLAKALILVERFGVDVFRDPADRELAQMAHSGAANTLYHDEFLGYSGKGLLLELRKAALGRGRLVPTTEGERPYINLDNGASTPALSPIWDVVCRTWRQPEPVRREIIREVKKICAGFLGAPAQEYDIIFTSNATEALNIAARSLGAEAEGDSEPVVLNTVLEHHSNELPWRYVPGVSSVRLPVDDEGFVDMDDLECLLREYNEDGAHGKKRIRVVAVSGASNVLGSYNDLQTISRMAHKYGARILVDGAQLVAHRRVDVEEFGIDFLAFSAHKMYAPFGSGALVVRKGLLSIDPGQLAKIKASGEENAAGIAALGKAITLLERVGMDVIEEEERALTRRILRGLSRMPEIDVYGVRDPDSPRLRSRAGVIAISFKSVPHNLAARELAEHGGIGVRNGCFCAHLAVQHSLRIHPIRIFVARAAFLLFSGLDDAVLPGMVRVSLGIENSEEDIDALMRTLERITAEPRSFLHRFIAANHNGTPLLGRAEMEEQMTGFAEAAAKEVYGSSLAYSGRSLA